VAGLAQDEQIPKLGEPVMKPLPVALRQADHRRGHGDELVGLQVDERCGLGLPDARRSEEQCRGDPKYRREPREDGGAWLLDATRLELRYRRARNTDTTCELGLSEMQPFARGPDRERQGRP
jgi:hypothetical protein